MARPGLRYVDEGGIREDLLCAICTDPVVKPRRPADCKHIAAFCRDCIVKAQRDGHTCCPVCRGGLHDLTADPTLEKWAEELPVYCANHPGCAWTGPRSNLTEHLERSCAHHQCTHAARGCAWTGTNSHMAAHRSDLCNFTMTPCPYASDGCTVRAERRLLSEHLKECPIALTRGAAGDRERRSEEERQRRVRELLFAVNPSGSEAVQLNVGGRMLMAARATLRAEKGSLLEEMFAGRYPLRTGSGANAGVVCIDRNGDAFALVLDWLRTGRVRGSLTVAERELMLTEAEFWQLKRLTDALKPA